jgi:altronate dehydratase large subunit
MNFQAYRRENGEIGVRNHLLVIPTSVCASATASKIAAACPDAVALPHQHGCCQIGGDHAQTVRTLTGMGRNPNVAAVLVVTLGCEGVQADAVAQGIAQTGKPVETVGIQAAGGEAAAVAQGMAALERLRRHALAARRVAADLAEIVLGVECGGSDATSGLAANPTVGAVSDLLVAAGGTSILSETTELIGAEDVLAARAASPALAERLLATVRRVEARAAAMGVDLREGQPTPGNVAGGITTIEEKSLGCIYKAGLAPLLGVLDYAEPPTGHGLFFMDTPGQDIESITGMVAGGAQVVIFTTGRGTPTGCAIAPVIKVTGNSRTFRDMPDCLDFDAGGIVGGGATVAETADRLFALLRAVCGGELTRAELAGHREFAIYRIGPTF